MQHTHKTNTTVKHTKTKQYVHLLLKTSITHTYIYIGNYIVEIQNTKIQNIPGCSRIQQIRSIKTHHIPSTCNHKTKAW